MRSSVDEVDAHILRLLAGNGRETVRAIAREVGLSEPSVHERLRALEERGVIEGYTVTLNPRAVAADTAAFIAIRFSYSENVNAKVEAALRRDPDVLEAHHVSGEDCYLIKVRVASTADLAATIDRIKRSAPGVNTRTTIALQTVFERPLRIRGSDQDRQRRRASATSTPSRTTKSLRQ